MTAHTWRGGRTDVCTYVRMVDVVMVINAREQVLF